LKQPHCRRLALAVLDASMLAAVARLAATLVRPMAAAIPASLARVGFAIQTVPKSLLG